jgi:hypothetical protein
LKYQGTVSQEPPDANHSKKNNRNRSILIMTRKWYIDGLKRIMQERPSPQLQSARSVTSLEAIIFHPKKFDNEKSTESTVLRQAMIRKCKGGDGYLEVSSKEHSGSQLLQKGNILTTHVFNDPTFLSFERQRGPGELSLFRGFSVGLLPEGSESDAAMDTSINETSGEPSTDEDVSRMSGVGNSLVSAELRSFISSLKDSFVDRAMEKRPGALVFFAGIPGCGKSTIVQGTEDRLKEVLNDRDITCLEGDMIKNKYWAAVKSKRFENPAAILLADKNTPPEIWPRVAEIASATQAIAIPVFHGAGALETTEVKGVRYPDGASHGGVYHRYPFSLKYLAVCMSRVLDRQPGSHPGKLDLSAPRACMIVLKFYAFYRQQKAEEVDTIVCDVLSSSNAMIPPAIVRIPFFQDGPIADLPKELSDILHEALRCQVRFSARECRESLCINICE